MIAPPKLRKIHFVTAIRLTPRRRARIPGDKVPWARAHRCFPETNRASGALHYQQHKRIPTVQQQHRVRYRVRRLFLDGWAKILLARLSPDIDANAACDRAGDRED